MMQLSAEILQALPRAGPSVFAGPIPTISKPNAKPIAGAFVEVTTKALSLSLSLSFSLSLSLS
eukprot:COSAG02_NODE_38913_length_423_cov_0.935185_1_plen_62_part_10